LPLQTCYCLAQDLEPRDDFRGHIRVLEIACEQMQTTVNMHLHKTLSRVGDILAESVVGQEVGSIDWFHPLGQLANYSGTTPKVNAAPPW